MFCWITLFVILLENRKKERKINNFCKCRGQVILSVQEILTHFNLVKTFWTCVTIEKLVFSFESDRLFDFCSAKRVTVIIFCILNPPPLAIITHNGGKDEHPDQEVEGDKEVLRVLHGLRCLP